MKNFSITLLLVVIFFGSCHVGYMQIYTAGPLKTYPENEHDGSSFEKGILLTQTDKKAAIMAEDTWVNNKYPGNKGYGRTLIYRNDIPFDRLVITTADGSQTIAYFDASTFIRKRS
jgi:hypothetical protein